MADHIQLDIASNKQYFFRVVSSNGNVIVHSETYSSRQNALNGMGVVGRACGAKRLDFWDVSAGKWLVLTIN